MSTICSYFERSIEQLWRQFGNAQVASPRRITYNTLTGKDVIQVVSPALIEARALLDSVTPLHSDCGAICGGACCRPDGDEENGMLLFPTEELLYPEASWAKVVESAWKIDGKPVPLLICDGTCPRSLRPLACRVFPLTLRIKGEGFRVVRDARAWPVCPLMPSGRKGLNSTFVEGVENAFSILWRDPLQQAYLRELDSLIALYRSL